MLSTLVTLTLLALATSGCLRDETRNGSSLWPAFQKVATEYYAASDDFLARERSQSDRDVAAMWRHAPRHNPVEATGRVADRWGRPTAGVRVEVAREEEEKPLGTGVTDEQGRFCIQLGTNRYRGLCLHVEAKGYEVCRSGGIYGGLVDYPIRLSATVDAKYMESLVAERDPERRLRALLEVLGDRQMGSLPLELLFPYLGSLRDDLRALISSDQFLKKDGRLFSPASSAASLLTYWCEPVDTELLRSRGLLNERLPNELVGFVGETGTTVEDVLAKHTASFAARKAPQPAYSNVVYSLDHSKALVQTHVMYAHWGYGYYLIMAHRNGQWQTVGQFHSLDEDYD
jgi:hypothetical protein